MGNGYRNRVAGRPWIRFAPRQGECSSARAVAWDLQNDARGALRDEWYVAAELDRITKTLLGMEKNGLARDLIPSKPQRLCEIAFFVSCLLGFPSPFVFSQPRLKSPISIRHNASLKCASA